MSIKNHTIVGFLLFMSVHVFSQTTVSVNTEYSCDEASFVVDVNIRQEVGSISVGYASVFLTYNPLGLEIDQIEAKNFYDLQSCSADKYFEQQFDTNTEGTLNLIVAPKQATDLCPEVTNTDITIFSIKFNVIDNSQMSMLEFSEIHNHINDALNSNVPIDELNFENENLPLDCAFYVDEDMDGFSSAEDCDDTNADINPDAEELPYNGIDDDCNTATLDDDLDQDGFPLAEDCDDSNADINPDAEEIPDNGIDEDCDGTDLITSIHQLASHEISIFPNPAVDAIIIQISGVLEYKATLLDLSGKELSAAINPTKLTIGHYPLGTYILEIQDLHTGQKILERIVKHR